MTKPKVILIVSADEDERAFFYEAIGVIDSAIVRLSASSTTEAVSYLQQTTALDPDLIFLTTNKPHEDSTIDPAPLKAIKKHSRSVVAIFSSLLSAEDQKQFADAGADFYLLKPGILIQMVSVLQYVFSRLQLKPAQQPGSFSTIA